MAKRKAASKPKPAYKPVKAAAASSSEEPTDDTDLEALRTKMGIEQEKPKVAGPITSGLTPNELYQMEMEFLAKGGSDPTGKEALRKAFNKLGR